MATLPMDENSTASVLWEAAKAGNTAEASRLLDEGAPLGCKNIANVSARCHGVRCGQSRVLAHSLSFCTTDRA